MFQHTPNQYNDVGDCSGGGKGTLSSKDLARHIAQTASDKKASDVVLLEIGRMTVIADYFVICTGTSERQISAITKAIVEDLGQEGVWPHHQEGTADTGWVLLDYGDVIVHIFGPTERDYYRLDRIWADAPKVLVLQ